MPLKRNPLDDVEDELPPIQKAPTLAEEEAATAADPLMMTLSRITDVLTQLAARQAVTGPDPSMAAIVEKLDATLARVAEAQLESGKLIALETKRSHRPSNEVVPNISVYNQRGQRDYPKPRLRCVMMIPWLVDNDSVTREEAELLNLIEAGSYVIERNDGVKVRLEARMEVDIKNRPSRLIVNNETAFNNENKREMPALRLILRQMLAQHDGPIAAAARGVLTSEEEETLILGGGLAVSV